ncbi:MAG: aldehyde dehydrogenase family protein, partial [Bradyrhizobium sp.]
MNIAVNAHGDQALEVVSPIDGKVYVRRSYSSGTEIEAALARAEAAARDWARTPLETRVALVARFGQE